jgi:hypothetical protein
MSQRVYSSVMNVKKTSQYNGHVTPPNNNNKFGGITMLQDNNKIKTIEI